MGIADFYVLMAALLAANLLTVAFVWAAWNYSRREQLGIEKTPGSGVYLSTMILVFAFLGGGFFFAAHQPEPTLQELMIDSAARLATENPPAASQ